MGAWSLHCVCKEEERQHGIRHGSGMAGFPLSIIAM